uniref:Uncharacterized protein n=1 Tax=Aplanochytrium stocchinoi TaxID=215587 RepID=A0A7S3LM09_9STRA|mmetsp:Transcript_10062/g.11440  ORF Transcript_10062/g.11440 Transcript_10062/m.11440 type:complete len:103 (+) Transcript_10062:218-526(+)
MGRCQKAFSLLLYIQIHTNLIVPFDKKFPKGWRFVTTKPEHQLDLKILVSGTTVNDVMLTLTAPAITRYYNDIKEPIMETKKDMTCTYAVNARPYGVEYHTF